MDIRELSDRQEIVDLVTRYTRAVDTGHWDGIDTVFGPDAVLDYTRAGGPETTRDEAKPFIRNLEGFTRWQHVIGQVAIDFDGPDAARVTAYFVNPMVSTNDDGSEMLWEVGGYYHHDVVRTTAGWRSTRMVDDLVWSRPPTPA